MVQMCFTEALLDAIAFHGTENSAACFRAVPENTCFYFLACASSTLKKWLRQNYVQAVRAH